MGSSTQNGSGVRWCRRRVKFNQVTEKVPKVPVKVPGSLGAKPSQVQQGSGEGSGQGSGEGSGGSGESRGGFGAEPGQVQQGSGEGSGEGLGGFGAEPGRVLQQGSGEGPKEGSGEGSGEGLGGFGAEPCQVQQGSGEGGLGGFGAETGHVQQGSGEGQVQQFPALGFAARFRKMCKNKTLRLLGIPAKLILTLAPRHMEYG